MKLPIPKAVKEFWDVWNLRSCILSSLMLQVFLLVFASRRQRSKSSLLLICIWLSYLLADWVPTVAIGIITKSQGDSCGIKGKDDLLAFWASFLLLHLGGPDSITSFALEDNQFWLRHLIGLILQVLLAFYSFFLTIPENRLLAPTILVFVVGTVKFAERTFALYLASSEHFAERVLPAPNPGPDYEEAAGVYSDMRSVQIETRSENRMMPNVVNYNSRETKFKEGENQNVDEIKLLDEAYSNFESFKGLIVGFLMSSRDRESSRRSFLRRIPNEAFRLIEYELCFMYQVLHTKVVVVRRKVGYILRIVSFVSIFAVSAMFYSVDKHGFKKDDTGLTYALLAGALSVEVISVFKLIFCLWTLIAPNKNVWTKGIEKVTLRSGKWSGWSQSVSQYNMIRYCLDERPKCLYNLSSCLYIKRVLDQIKIWHYSSSATVTEELKSFIFNELRAKSLTASTLRAATEACSQRGDWALLRTSSYEDLKWSVGEFQFAESLLLWHLATELCYHDPKATSISDDEEANESKRICKILSDYLFCLLVSQPAMLAPVLGNWHIAFQDTCAEAKRFFSKHGLSKKHPSEACKKILETTTKFRSAAVKGNKSKSVLFDANILAEKLRNLKNDQWNLMSRVWLELLSYAAINCRPIVHAQQLSKGGELLTFTWLLMCHLGLGTQFYEQEQQAGKKMVATK